MLLDQIKTEMLAALKSGDKTGHLTRQLLLGEIHNAKMQKQKELSDEEIWQVIRQQVKQREESITAYKAGKRDDLVAKEQAEIEILSKYLPQEMMTAELEKVVKEVIGEIVPDSPADFGKVMGVVMGRVKGKVSGDKVANTVKLLLEN